MAADGSERRAKSAEIRGFQPVNDLWMKMWGEYLRRQLF
jgi:hypothetical protein